MIRQATAADLDHIHQLGRLVTENLHSLGIDQWSAMYPLRSHFEQDLNRHGLYVFEQEGMILGAMALLPENDPPYLAIPFSEGQSFVIHRIMVHPQWMRGQIGKQLFQFAFDYAKSQGAEWMKIDTHPDNFRMRSFLEKSGFRYVGYMPSIHRFGYEYAL